MKINIYEKISQWLMDCPDIGDYVYFNVIPFESDTASVNSSSSSSTLTTYNDGSKEVRIFFLINIIKHYDNGGTSDLNLDAINTFDKIINYVETKNSLSQYPDLGDTCVPYEIGSTYKAPEVYITPDNPNIARYEGQFYLEYLERK